MEDNTSAQGSDSGTENQTQEPPAPEVLKPQNEDAETQEPEQSQPSQTAGKHDDGKRQRRRTYRPSHKATFIGLAAVAAILAVNAIVITIVIKSQSKSNKASDQVQVAISPDTLSKLGVSRNSVGDSGVELIVNPDARFAGKVEVGGDVSIAGQLQLNGKFSANEASFAKLQAGDTTLTKLNVNEDGTLSSLNLRKDLAVAGNARVQGTATFSQLVSIANSLNVAGNLGVAGTLAVGKLSVSNLTVGGHIITLGSAPGVGPGSCIGSNGTVSISGNDAAGTVAINIGTGACAGTFASVAFRNQYGSLPHVIISPVGRGIDKFYVTRTVGGFTIGASSAPSAGGYAFDYIVAQ